MSFRDAADGASPTSLTLALARASRELLHLSDCVERLQHCMPMATSKLDPDLCERLQELDYLNQHLDELRTFLSALAAQADPAWAVDIHHVTTDIRLSQLAGRLRGLLDSSRNNDPQDSGELELLLVG